MTGVPEWASMMEPCKVCQGRNGHTSDCFLGPFDWVEPPDERESEEDFAARVDAMNEEYPL